MKIFPIFCLFVLSAALPSALKLAEPMPQPAKTGAPMLLVANQFDKNITVIDPGSQQQLTAIAVTGTTGHELTVSPDGHTAYVPIYGNSGVGKPGTDGRTMDVIDLRSHKVIHTIDFGHGVRPHCVLYDRHANHLLVTTELDQSVTVIDPNTLKIIGSIPTGQPESHMLVLSHDGRRGYTANVGPGTVSVLDLAARKTIAIIPISAETQRISISQDDTMVFTADQTAPQLAVINTATNKVTAHIALPALGYGTAAAIDGRWLLVALPSINKVAFVDLHTLKVTATVDVPAHPTEILVRPDAPFAYVSCLSAQQVAVIDLEKKAVVTSLKAGAGADGLAWVP